ncbi:alpha/beta-hydrolase [Russula earlei]|uniref:Alpha/beta-hydrolase n=1 Tax=Russula earlei TaxID=71964 RepID=A0ACC0U5M5_9AGAM|nr:alpha/beta-hydrolase [Russula earlei]
MKYQSVLVLISAIVGTLASPTQDVLAPSKHRPLVIWHGLGDSYDSPGILKFQSSIEEMYPGIFIHSVYIDPDSKEDRRATYYGNVNDQVELVAEQLKHLHHLSGGFDAIGFSQGGQFLRAYVERYNDPPIRNLITFGSQHMGVADIPPCRTHDLLCNLARRAARAGAYNEWAQENLVQAQYYRDPAQLARYLESNRFLTSVNNELPAPRKNATYAEHLAQLDALVLVLFEQDGLVVPKESAWFGSYATEDGDDDAQSPFLDLGREVKEGEGERAIVPMREQSLYVEDWIGLRTLDESGRVVLASCDSEHMQLSVECWQPLVKQYVGSRS